MTGVPGRSNALAIAGRLGMPQEILEAASGMLDPDELRVDSLLQDIRRRRDEADALLERARGEEEQARTLRDVGRTRVAARRSTRGGKRAARRLPRRSPSWRRRARR